jgi:hypothetical protein
MVTLDPHPQLRQIGHDTLPDTFPTEIMENKPGRYATIGTEHKSSAFRLGETRLRCYGHHYLRSTTWLNSDRHHTSQALNWIVLEWVSPKEGRGEAWLVDSIQRWNLIDDYALSLTGFKPLCYTVMFSNGGRAYVRNH